MNGGPHTWMETPYNRLIKAQVIQRDGLFCCKVHGCGRPATHDDLLLDKLEGSFKLSNCHVLCVDCWTRKAVQFDPPLSDLKPQSRSTY